MSTSLYPSQLLANLNQTKLIPGNASVTALFSTSTYAFSATIMPLNANGADIAIDYVNPPLNKAGITLPAIPGRMYDLSKIFIQAANGSDGVEVLWID